MKLWSVGLSSLDNTPIRSIMKSYTPDWSIQDWFAGRQPAGGCAQEVVMAILKLNGVELFYRQEGFGTPLLLIHGTGMSSELWGAAVQDLATDHRVLVYDRR